MTIWPAWGRETDDPADHSHIEVVENLDRLGDVVEVHLGPDGRRQRDGRRVADVTDLVLDVELHGVDASFSNEVEDAFAPLQVGPRRLTDMDGARRRIGGQGRGVGDLDRLAGLVARRVGDDDFGDRISQGQLRAVGPGGDIERLTVQGAPNCVGDQPGDDGGANGGAALYLVGARDRRGSGVDREGASFGAAECTFGGRKGDDHRVLAVGEGAEWQRRLAEWRYHRDAVAVDGCGECLGTGSGRIDRQHHRRCRGRVEDCAVVDTADHQ